MYFPQIDDELDTLCNYLDVQLDALRTSVHGLTEDQARERPLRSALSLAGILTHATWCMAGALSCDGDDDAEASLGDFFGSFTPDESLGLDEILERFDSIRARYMAMCRAGDLDAVMDVGPFEWAGMTEARPAKMRYLYVHHIEEFARHAGHADIIREQIDGADAASLTAAVEGWEPNRFVTPWSAEASKG